jgi:hypothetical protein
MRLHDLNIQGDSPPDPIQEFTAAGFPRDVLEEVRRPRPAGPRACTTWRAAW